MVFKVFVDTDIIIDLLIDRQPFGESAAEIFNLADNKAIFICTSALSINNVHYICRKIIGDRESKTILSELLDILEILSVSKGDISNALKSNFKDFEDAIQHAVAISDEGIKSIITRNTKDYKKARIPVFDSETFVKMISNENEEFL